MPPKPLVTLPVFTKAALMVRSAPALTMMEPSALANAGAVAALEKVAVPRYTVGAEPAATRVASPIELPVPPETRMFPEPTKRPPRPPEAGRPTLIPVPTMFRLYSERP